MPFFFLEINGEPTSQNFYRTGGILLTSQARTLILGGWRQVTTAPSKRKALAVISLWRLMLNVFPAFMDRFPKFIALQGIKEVLKLIQVKNHLLLLLCLPYVAYQLLQDLFAHLIFIFCGVVELRLSLRVQIHLRSSCNNLPLDTIDIEGWVNFALLILDWSWVASCPLLHAHL